MRASCSIIIPGRVTSTSATSAISASMRIAAMRRRHGLPRRPTGFSAGGAPELSVFGRSRMARSAGWSRLCGVLCQRRASGPRRPSASGRTRSRAFAAAHTGWPPPRFGRREQRVRHRGVPRLLTVPGSPWRCAGRSASFAVTPRSTCWLGCFIRNRSTTGTSRAATVGLRHQLRGVLARPMQQPRPAADRRKVLSRYSAARESRNEHAAEPRLRPTAYDASAKARVIRRAASF